MVNMQAVLKEGKCIPNCHHSTKRPNNRPQSQYNAISFYSYQDYLTLYPIHDSAEKKLENFKQEVKISAFLLKEQTISPPVGNKKELALQRMIS